MEPLSNYIEKLKNYWKSSDLTFIATFKKINSNSGFFNHFINPSSKMRLFYPSFDDIEIEDKRVSFFYANGKEIVDGHLYKVKLQHSNNPKGNNNPYSLEIESVTALDQEKIKTFLVSHEDESESQTVFVGRYLRVRENLSVFTDVMFEDSGEILMGDGIRQEVYVSPKITLDENKFYKFSIIKSNGKRPNAILKTISPVENNPYQDYIRLRFERLNNPEANKMIANLMREIGKGMYSSKQRMIFELLQNADDSPAKEKVEFHIDINGDYFFVMHDGAPFNKDDVEAITSAAESTKRGDSKKTGYKGIGFKSVFTDSTEVWIKSGGYQFAFQRNHYLFNDFDKFYFSSQRYKKYPELLEEDKLKYRNQKLKFNGSTDIPWQVIPIWQENLPSEFNDSNFNNFNNPVQFALKLGESNIEEYKSAIDNITKRPQFLLFLRNTSKFRSPKNGVTVIRNDKGSIIEIEKSKVVYANFEREQQIENYHYTKHFFDDIPVSDEAFFELNIGLKKQSKINDYNEVIYYFTDLEGREIETIPPKLASVSETEISFGIPLIDNKISPEKEYIQGLPKYSSLFTYLPMEDTRFQLPFLVNADFVPSSDRQKIQGDNLWNKYIMIKVAEMHVKTLNFFANEFKNDISSNNSYLSLLLKTLLPDDDTAQQIIESYNEKYIEQLRNEPIIVNDQEDIQLLAETIIDNSGIVELFDNDIFYEIVETEKRLPHLNLEVKCLMDYKYLNVELIDLEDLAQRITPDICERFGEVIKTHSCYDKPELMSWLDKLAAFIPDNFGKIPFIVHNSALYSIETLLSESEVWIINKNTKEFEELLKGLGYHTINFQLEKYSNINNYLLSVNGYINDKTLAYERIASNANIHKLQISQKIQLINFLQNSTFMLGIGEKRYFNELCLFVDSIGVARPLRHLLSHNYASEVHSLNQFLINNNEFNGLTDALKKELISQESVFTSFILNHGLFKEWSLQFTSQNIAQYVTDLKTIYSWKDEGEEILQSQWAAIPWLYIDDDIRFIESNNVLWSSAFDEMNNDKFLIISEILQKSQLKTITVQICGDLVSHFKLATDRTLITEWTLVQGLDTISANCLLDWMEDDGDYSDFFEEYNFISDVNGLWSITEVEDTQIFDGTNEKLKTYINSIEGLKNLFTELNTALCSENRSKIGLLQDDKLLKAIIKSKAYDQNLASLLPQDLPWNILEDFISNLSEFKLKANSEYNGSSPEHLILSQLIKNIEDINSAPEKNILAIESLRAKITINQNPLSHYDLSDKIHFGKGEDRKSIKLSDVVNGFQGESDILDNLIESFVAIKEKAKLRKLIFKTRLMPYDEICKNVETETSPYYSVYQVVFQLLYKKYVGDMKWPKEHFDDFWKDQGNEPMLHTSYKSFLDIILDLDFTDLSGFSFLDLELNNCVDKNWAIDSETLPKWLMDWVNIKQIERLAFISKLGYNGTDSSIVELRKAALSENYNQNTVIRYFEEAKSNTQIIWNTIHWLSNYSSQIVTRNIALIKQINNYITLNTKNLQLITIPIIESINKDNFRTYKLQSVNITSKLLTIKSDEELSFSIFSTLKKVDDSTLFIDSNCGKKSAHFKNEEVKLIESVDSESLDNNSKLWEEPYYKKWEHYAKYPIYIFNGSEIPHIRTFNNIMINQFSNDLKVENDGKFFVSGILKSDVLNNLPSSFPDKALTSLKEWHYRTLQNESLLDEDSYEYNETFDRMLQDRFGLSAEQQKEESGNAKTHALYYLKELGFDLDNGTTNGAALYNITNEFGVQVTCIVRSAKGGLLYIDKEHWEMLEYENTYLVAIYPGNEPRLFRNRLELLSEDLAENVLFRIPNTKDSSEIDGVFDALESESHLILVTSEKMKENLFSKLKKKDGYHQEKDTAIKGDDFSFN